METKENFKKWSSEKVIKYNELLENGQQIKESPYFDNNPFYKKGNIVFDYTQNEIKEIAKSAKDIIYFAENYTKVMTDDGVKTIALRDYQERILKGFDENRFNILLASRQVGKCVNFDSIINIENKKTSIGVLYFKELKKVRYLTFLEKIKYNLYKLFIKTQIT